MGIGSYIAAIGDVCLAVFASIGALVILFFIIDWFTRKRRLSQQQQWAQRVIQRTTPTAPRAATGEAKQITRPPELAVGTFAPISDASIDLWSGGFFGRRDLIPPVTDPRTLLIDKAMVAHGLITPEELTEIHRTGEAMDAIRPDLAAAQSQGLAQAEQIERDRAALKAQRKAEAAERKRVRAEAVAKRKATDILYLGPGVSKGLADRTSNLEKLQAANLPVLATPADLAAAMNLPIPRLRWLAYHTPAATRTHYLRFEVPKRRGGKRLLFAPHEDLAAAQEWILRNILDKVPTHPAAHGFVKTRSTLTNATPHVAQGVVLNADLTNFFPTITFPRVRGIFKQLGYSGAASTILALLCTECPRRIATYAGQTLHVAAGPRALPQGACTSPALSNLAARRLDSRLTGIAQKLAWKYTRYADDLTFSASTPSPGTPGEGRGEGLSHDSPTKHVGYLLARIRHIAHDEGFLVNESKTRVLRQSTRQSVTGVVVNRRPGAPRPLVRRLRAILHRAKSEGLAQQNRENHSHFQAWLEGMIAYIEMLNQKQGSALRRALEQLSSE